MATGADSATPSAETVRFATAADAEACNAFFNRVRGTARTLEQWRWEFAPAGGDPSAYVLVERDGEVLGVQALLPVQMVGPEGTFPSAKSEESLVDPALRGSGAFGRMYDLLFERAAHEGYRAIWGFTEATRAFERVGFAVPAVTRRLMLPITGAGARLLAGPSSGAGRRFVAATVGRAALAAAAAWSRARRALRRSGLRAAAGGVRVASAESPPEGCDALSRAFVAMWGGVTIHRDQPYLAWRVFADPHVTPVMRCAYDDDRLVGFAVWAVGGRGIGYLVDLVVADEAGGRTASEKVAALLVDDAVSGLAGAGAVAVVAMSATDHPFDLVVRAACRAAGFLPAGAGNPVVLWLPPSGSGVPDAPAAFGDWYVTRLFTEGLDG